MKFWKITKSAKWLMSFAIITSGVIGISVPIITQTSLTNTRNTSDTIQTGKIVHDSDVQIVNNVSDIAIGNVSIFDVSHAIVANNGVQEVYVWGFNIYGQLGIGTNENVTEPTKFDLSVFPAFRTISLKFGYIGTHSSYAIVDTIADGQQLYTWGRNNVGQLGLSSNVIAFSIPQKVNKESLGNFDEIIGINSFEPVAIESIYSGDNTMFVITRKGTVSYIYAAGNNDSGQFGLNNTFNSTSFKLISASILTENESIIKFTYTNSSCYLIKKNSGGNQELWVWGYNTDGRLGLRDYDNRLVPTRLVIPYTGTIAPSLTEYDLNFSPRNGYALRRSTGELHVWGDNTYGQLGYTFNVIPHTPTIIKMTTATDIVKKVSIGATNSTGTSWALCTNDGIDSLYVWGRNDGGQLGIGSTGHKSTPIKLNLNTIGNPSISEIQELKIGSYLNSYAIVNKNGVQETYAWGYNAYGQLGNGNTANVLTPTKVTSPTSFPITNFSINDGFTQLTVNNNGINESYVAGLNNKGQLGVGNSTSVTTFTKVLPIRNLNILPIKGLHDKTAAEAYDELKGQSTDQDGLKALLAKYMNLSNLPPNVSLKLGDVSINNTNGSLTINIVPDKIYKQLVIAPVPNNEPVTITIPGFKIVKSIKSSPVVALTNIPKNFNADQLFTTLVKPNGLADYDLLSKYINLDAIPNTASIKLTRLPNSNVNKLDFIFSASLVYDDEGRIVPQLEEQVIRLDLTPFPVVLIAILGSVGGVLIIAFIVWYVMFHARRNAIKTFTEYLE